MNRCHWRAHNPRCGKQLLGTRPRCLDQLEQQFVFCEHYAQCGGAEAGLNGEKATGLLTDDSSVTPNVLTLGYATSARPPVAGLSVGNATPTPPAGVSAYALGGSVSTLVSDTSIVLVDSGTTPLTIAADGTFSFATPLATGSSYAVTVSSQPPGETCTINNCSGTVAFSGVTNIAVNCSLTNYTIGGIVAGLTGAGTSSAVYVLLNTFLAVPVSANGNFTAGTLPYGSNYNVTIVTQPSGLTCTVNNGSGTVGTANVTNVAVTCTPATYSVQVSVTGLIDSGLTLLLNGGDSLSTSAAGPATFSSQLSYDAAYAVTIESQPSDQLCQVQNGSATVYGNGAAISVYCPILFESPPILPSPGNWTWMYGSNQPGAGDVGGTEGVPTKFVGPGAAQNSITWTYANGDFWLYGGNGNNNFSTLYDGMWKYTLSTGFWTWL